MHPGSPPRRRPCFPRCPRQSAPATATAARKAQARHRDRYWRRVHARKQPREKGIGRQLSPTHRAAVTTAAVVAGRAAIVGRAAVLDGPLFSDGPLLSPSSPAASSAPLSSPTSCVAGSSAPLSSPTRCVAGSSAPLSSPTSCVAGSSAPLSSPTSCVAGSSAPVPVAKVTGEDAACERGDGDLRVAGSRRRAGGGGAEQESGQGEQCNAFHGWVPPQSR